MVDMSAPSSENHSYRFTPSCPQNAHSTIHQTFAVPLEGSLGAPEALTVPGSENYPRRSLE